MNRVGSSLGLDLASSSGQRLSLAKWQRVQQSLSLAEKRLKQVAGKRDAGTREQRLHEACQQFEALFLGYLLKEMRKTIQRSHLLPEDFGEKIYISMFDDEVAKLAGKAGGVGLAEIIYEKLRSGSEQQHSKGKEESAKDRGLTFRYERR